MATLVVVSGPAEGQKFALENHGLVMIGRDHSCTFQVLDPKMSRHHLQIKFDKKSQEHSAIDFDSANGVYVNNKRVEGQTTLGDGDMIRAGKTGIVYSVQDDPDAQTITQLLRKHFEGRNETQITSGSLSGSISALPDSAVKRDDGPRQGSRPDRSSLNP